MDVTKGKREESAGCSLRRELHRSSMLQSSFVQIATCSWQAAKAACLHLHPIAMKPTFNISRGLIEGGNIVSSLKANCINDSFGARDPQWIAAFDIPCI